MPLRNRKRCPSPGCGSITAGGKCEACKAKVELRRGTSSDRGYGSEWRRLVRDPYLKAHPRCERPGCDRRAREVDHIKPRIHGGTDDWDNLQSLCRPHHSSKTAKENALGGAR